MKTDQATTPDESLGAGQLAAINAGRARLREARKSERAEPWQDTFRAEFRRQPPHLRRATAEVSMVQDQDYAECTSDDDMIRQRRRQRTLGLLHGGSLGAAAAAEPTT